MAAMGLTCWMHGRVIILKNNNNNNNNLSKWLWRQQVLEAQSMTTPKQQAPGEEVTETEDPSPQMLLHLRQTLLMALIRFKSLDNLPWWHISATTTSSNHHVPTILASIVSFRAFRNGSHQQVPFFHRPTSETNICGSGSLAGWWGWWQQGHLVTISTIPVTKLTTSLSPPSPCPSQCQGPNAQCPGPMSNLILWRGLRTANWFAHEVPSELGRLFDSLLLLWLRFFDKTTKRQSQHNLDGLSRRMLHAEWDSQQNVWHPLGAMEIWQHVVTMWVLAPTATMTTKS
jgi:hypothetical protein